MNAHGLFVTRSAARDTCPPRHVSALGEGHTSQVPHRAVGAPPKRARLSMKSMRSMNMIGSFEVGYKAAMERSDLVARLSHDLGLAAWFGGTLMGAVGLNAASSESRHELAGEGEQGSDAWTAWTPVNAVAIGMHLLGGAALVGANKSRMASQSGVASASAAKMVLTGAALGATAYARVLGQQMISTSTSVDGPTVDSFSDRRLAQAQQRLKVLQWAIPALTGALVVLSSVLGEQQRPASVAQGVLERLHLG